VTGKAWEDYIQDSLLGPLQMAHTYTSLKLVPASVKLPQPYTTSFTGELHPVPLDHWDNLGPAADLISSVSDLSHWLLCQLDSGRYDGRRVLPFAVLQKTRGYQFDPHQPEVGRGADKFYRLWAGVEVSDYKGRQVYLHTGGAAGMVSILTFCAGRTSGSGDTD